MHDLQAGSAARILVVEDESGILAALTLLLDMEGYRVTEATNGRQALECLRAGAPDLVITDYMMPYMNGVELMRQIRQDPELTGLPIILLSAALPEDTDLAGLADATLSKPVSIDELLDAIARLLPPRH